jgi:DNA modification methylase
MEPAYTTEWGACYSTTAEQALASEAFKKYRHQVDLIFTSPPFPLNRKKKYGNRQGQSYMDWLAGCAQLFCDFLKPTGSIVIELGSMVGVALQKRP